MAKKNEPKVIQSSEPTVKVRTVTRKSDGKKMTVDRVSNTGSYVCFSNEGKKFEGNYTADEVIVDA